MQGNGAAFLNLSLLSADLWSAVARCLFFDGFPSVLAVVCFVAAVLVTGSGLVLYTWSGGVADEEEGLQLERASLEDGQEAAEHARAPAPTLQVFAHQSLQ